MEPTEPQTGTPCRKHRWFQFSLRTLLVIMVLASVAMSWFAVMMQRARRQKEAVEAIIQSGGDVGYDFQYDESGGRLPDARPVEPEWLRSVLGVDFFANVRSVDFRDASDSDLEHLQGLSQVDYLAIYGGRITDKGVKKLQEALPNCAINRNPPTEDEWQSPAAPDQLR